MKPSIPWPWGPERCKARALSWKHRTRWTAIRHHWIWEGHALVRLPRINHCGTCRTPQRWGEAGKGIRLKEALLFLLVCWFSTQGCWPGPLPFMLDIFHRAQRERTMAARRRVPEAQPQEPSPANSSHFELFSIFPRELTSYPTHWPPDSLSRAFPAAALIPSVFTRILTQKCTSIGKKLKKQTNRGTKRRDKTFLSSGELRKGGWSTIHTLASQLCSGW